MQLLRALGARMEQLFALRASHGPYRFLVRRWDRVSDIDLAMNVIATDCFREQLRPLPLPIETFAKVLVLAPHQDDEVIGAGGTLLKMSRLGATIQVLFVTDGLIDPLPAYACSREEERSIRSAEASRVCNVLNAEMLCLSISNQAVEVSESHLRQLADIIKVSKPQAVLMPWILDSAPKHRLVNHLLYLAHKRFLLPAFEVWGYQVHNSLLANSFVDITDVIDEKISLIRLYESQVKFMRRYDHIARGMAAWNSRLILNENKQLEEQYFEVFFTLPSDELFRIVERFYLPDLRKTYRGHLAVLPGMRRLQERAVAKGND
jgi:LmbE family N-acetylglucosaminyl deacetylase